jgi:alpha-glucosidase
MIRVDAPLETVPLFVRGGAILALGPEQNYVGEKATDPLQFEIYPDASGEASTLLYEDDGLTDAYQRGSYRQTGLSYRHTAEGDRIDLSVPIGQFHPAPRVLLLTVRPVPTIREVMIDGKSQARAATVRITDDGRSHRIELH